MKGIVIVASTKDIAGLNIAKALIEGFRFKEADERFDGQPVFEREHFKVVFTKDDIIYADYLDSYFTPYSYIFISRHRSESRIPCLTTHFPGNFTTDTSFGGKSKELAFTYPSQLKNYLNNLWSVKSEAERYQVVIETTHHGPTSLKKPVLFAEIGSSEEEWRDLEAARLVAKALWKTLQGSSAAEKIGIAFGGPHYPEKFTKFLIKSEYGVGAIASKHVLPFIDRGILSQMIQKCVENVKYAILDWKGLGHEKARIVSLLGESGLEIVRL